jgi:hypothetical protein
LESIDRFMNPKTQEKRLNQWITGTLKELENVDPKSQAFRYATKRNGSQSVDDSVRTDLQKFSHVMGQLMCLLVGCFDWVAAGLRDMEAAAR